MLKQTSSIMSKNIKLNILTYLIFLLITSVGIFYGNQIRELYPNLRIWDTSNLFIMLLGIPFLFLQRQAGIPDFWQKNISSRKRFLIPFLVGLLFGVLDVLVFKIILHPEPYNELPPFLQPFPYSILLYFSGAFEVEVFYRLIPVTVICLIGNKFRNGRYEREFLIFAIILTSLREPIEQMTGGAVWLITYSIFTGFAMNLIQAIFYKTTGLLASLSLRLGHYFLWHIILGVYVEFIELS
jgi:hypothetical protein